MNKLLIEELIFGLENGRKLDNLKKEICKKYKALKNPPSNIEILNHLTTKQRKKYSSFFITKPTRTGSGVAPIAVMAKPFKCPHGKCTYCPGGPNSVFGNVPQSYTGKEPASMRAVRANYNPYIQVFNRLEQYVVLGQIPEKCEVIVMGGTFPGVPKSYQEEFITLIFKAMNDFSKLFFLKNEFNFEKFKSFFELPGNINNEKRIKNIHKNLIKLQKTNKKPLEKEQKINETAKIRCIGLTVETRPDYATEKEANELLRLGCTRVEIGIQTTNNNTLQNINRDHTVEQTISSIKTLKDMGFKINAHVMPGLPGSNKEADIKMLNELFSNENFRPDMLKIYPCIVMPGTELYKDYKNKKFTPLTSQGVAEIIAEFKKSCPRYIRIMRINRDIPTYKTEAGIDMTNLRQLVSRIMQEKGYKCNCIRCREFARDKMSSHAVKRVGAQSIESQIGKTNLTIQEYNASEGKEFFISINDEADKIIGFCRLRIPSQILRKEKPLRKEFTNKTAIIRELHVYSDAIAIGKKSKTSLQHCGFGKLLVKTAEKITAQHKLNKILVISGIGVREYYKKLGYKLEGVYMSKEL